MMVPSASVTAAWKVTPCAMRPARFSRTRWLGSNCTAKSSHRYCHSLPIQHARRIPSDSLRDPRNIEAEANMERMISKYVDELRARQAQSTTIDSRPRHLTAVTGAARGTESTFKGMALNHLAYAQRTFSGPGSLPEEFRVITAAL